MSKSRKKEKEPTISDLARRLVALERYKRAYFELSESIEDLALLSEPGSDEQDQFRTALADIDRSVMHTTQVIRWYYNLFEGKQ